MGSVWIVFQGDPLSESRWQPLAAHAGVFSTGPGLVARWREVIAIAVTDVPQQTDNYQRATVRQVCLMVVSGSWISIASAYEGAVENKLFNEGRVFTKHPLKAVIAVVRP